MDSTNEGNKEVLEKSEVISKEINNIIVIGNGFDISVGLKSAYNDFIEFIKTKNRFYDDQELYNYNRLFLRKYANFELNWSDFESLYEETVKKVNQRTQQEELQDSFEIATINDSIKKLESDFHEYLSDEYARWLLQNTTEYTGTEFRQFTNKINPFFDNLIRDEHSYFINFNYTNTIENLCESVLYVEDEEESGKTENFDLKIRKAKERVFHIHGSLEDENILFGGGFTDSADITGIHYTQSLINDKLFRIKENETLSATRKLILDKVDSDNIFDLYILGHSLQGSDFTFLSKMIKKANRVFIFYYEKDYSSKMEEILRQSGSEIAEKIILIPFLEIFLPSETIVSKYEQYQSVECFLPNKFPNEELLTELTLTVDHFIFRNIRELRINAKNIEMILKILDRFMRNEKLHKITKLYFEETLESDSLNRLKSSKAFLTLLEKVEKVYFVQTEVDLTLLEILLNNGDYLNFIRMEHCVLVNDKVSEIDISVCESLRRLEIEECTFTTDSKKVNAVQFSSSSVDNKLERLSLVNNSYIIFDNSMLTNSKNLLDLHLILSDTDIASFEAHMENLEILRIDCSKAQFPKITVGQKIKEIVIVGYPEETLSFSDVMKNEEGTIGFPNLRLFQLVNPDYIKSGKEFVVDVLLDVFSDQAKFIVDKETIGIYDFYAKYYNDQAIQFLKETKKVVEDTLIGTIAYDEKKVNKLYESFETWYTAISEKVLDSSINEEFLTMVKTKLKNPKRIQTVYNTLKSSISEYVMEEAELNDYYNPKNQTKGVDYSKVEKQQIFDVAESSLQDMPKQEVTLKESNTAEVVGPILSKTVIEIIKEFSKEWFVSKEELEFSAMQYQPGMDSIPNLKKIIESKDFQKYKLKNPEAKVFKYLQDMKNDWQKVLDEKIAPLINSAKKEIDYNE